MTRTIEVPKGVFQLRDYRPDDEADVLELWKTAFGKELPLEMWRWKYVENPFGSRILMCLDENGDKPVVVYGGVPYRTSWNGRVVRAVQLMDIMSHPDYRKTGLFVKTGIAFCDQFIEEADAALVYGFPGRYHFDIGRKYLRYAEIPSGVGWFSGQLKSIARARGFLGGRVEAVPEASRDFDGLWESVRDSYPLAVIRDAAFIGWRFSTHPLRKYTVFTYRAGITRRLRGYAVVGDDDGMARIVDCLVPEDPRGAVDCLGQLAGDLEELGFDRLETWLPTSHFAAQAAVDAGLRPGPEPLGIIPTMVDFNKDPTTNWVSDNLYYTMADADLM